MNIVREKIIENNNSGSGGGSSSSVLFVEKKYDELLALKNAGTLVPGTTYKITDRADKGIIITAITTTDLSLECRAIFLNADFQNVGNYTGIEAITGVATGLRRGVFTNSETYSIGEIYIWNGLHYQITNIVEGGLGTSYTSIELSKNINVGYIEEVDFITYHFANDTILSRADKRCNRVNYYPFDFQWGNDLVAYNFIDSSGYAQIINQKGSIVSNTILSSGELYADETFVSGFSNNKQSNASVIHLDASTGTINGCEFSAFGNYYIKGAHEKKRFVSGFSNFEADIDLSDNTVWDGNGVLTINPILNYVGVFNLLNIGTQPPIEVIHNLPTNHHCNFKCDKYEEIGFTSTGIASAITDNIVSDVAGTVTLIGRLNGSDYIELKKDGEFNVRKNIIKLA